MIVSWVFLERFRSFVCPLSHIAPGVGVACLHFWLDKCIGFKRAFINGVLASWMATLAVGNV